MTNPIPTPSPEQIASDRYYLGTSETAKEIAVGDGLRMLHDLKTIGKVHPAQRWYRYWQKTSEGWVFEGMQFGRNEIVRGDRGCCMPGRCLMVGEHYASECHDAEMLEAFEREMRRSDRP